jgi:hypothetical protein
MLDVGDVISSQDVRESQVIKVAQLGGEFVVWEVHSGDEATEAGAVIGGLWQLEIVVIQGADEWGHLVEI